GLVAAPSVCGQQDLGALHPAHRRPATGNEGLQHATLLHRQLDDVSYVHRALLLGEHSIKKAPSCPLLHPHSPTCRASTWPLSTPTAQCTAARPPRPTCRPSSRSRRPASTGWCSSWSSVASSVGGRVRLAASSCSYRLNSCRCFDEPATDQN